MAADGPSPAHPRLQRLSGAEHHLPRYSAPGFGPRAGHHRHHRPQHRRRLCGHAERGRATAVAGKPRTHRPIGAAPTGRVPARARQIARPARLRVHRHLRFSYSGHLPAGDAGELSGAFAADAARAAGATARGQLDCGGHVGRIDRLPRHQRSRRAGHRRPRQFGQRRHDARPRLRRPDARRLYPGPQRPRPGSDRPGEARQPDHAPLLRRQQAGVPAADALHSRLRRPPSRSRIAHVPLSWRRRTHHRDSARRPVVRRPGRRHSRQRPLPDPPLPRHGQGGRFRAVGPRRGGVAGAGVPPQHQPARRPPRRHPARHRRHGQHQRRHDLHRRADGPEGQARRGARDTPGHRGAAQRHRQALQPRAAGADRQPADAGHDRGARHRDARPRRPLRAGQQPVLRPRRDGDDAGRARRDRAAGGAGAGATRRNDRRQPTADRSHTGGRPPVRPAARAARGATATLVARLDRRDPGREAAACAAPYQRPRPVGAPAHRGRNRREPGARRDCLPHPARPAQRQPDQQRHPLLGPPAVALRHHPGRDRSA